MFHVGLLIVRLCFMSDVKIASRIVSYRILHYSLIDCIVVIYSAIAANVFNKLIYLFTYLLTGQMLYSHC